jgi:hypothetical protein
MRAHLLLLPLLSLGCKSDYTVNEKATSTRTGAELELEVFGPDYGTFLGDAPATVSGKVSPPQAMLLVEGTAVEVDADGFFTVDLPVDHAYRWLEVEAALDEQAADWRTMVFSGVDPAPGWPGGITARIHPAGFEALSGALGALIDGIGWADQLADQLPAYETDWFAIRPVGVFHDPTEVELEPRDGEIGVEAALRNVKLEYEIASDPLGLSTELSVAFGQVAITTALTPEVDSNGMLWLQLADEGSIALDEPDFVITVFEGWLLEAITDAVLNYVVEPLGDLLLGYIGDEFGTIELGGPLAGETDLLGVPVSFELADLFTDVLGLGAELGIGIGGPMPSSIGVPMPDEATPGAEGAHATVAVHEGVLQVAMSDLLVGIFEGELGTYLDLAGGLLGSMVEGLPGGEQAPDGVGWCLDISPGDAYVARMHEGTAPLATIYLPDLQLSMDRQLSDGSCAPWLSASLATEIGVVAEGSAVNFDLGIPEGHIVSYGAEGADEAAVIAGLSAGIEGALGGILGSFGIDLADLLGGLGGEGAEGDPLAGLGELLAIEVTDSQPYVQADGSWDEGLYAVSMRIFKE